MSYLFLKLSRKTSRKIGNNQKLTCLSSGEVVSKLFLYYLFAKKTKITSCMINHSNLKAKTLYWRANKWILLERRARGHLLYPFILYLQSLYETFLLRFRAYTTCCVIIVNCSETGTWNNLSESRSIHLGSFKSEQSLSTGRTTNINYLSLWVEFIHSLDS